jgi:type IV pilus assembly protein PilW
MTSPGQPNRRARGFTLLEMMVGAVVTTIILMGVAASFVATQQAYQNEAEIKGAVEGARVGIAYLERVVKLAGYGIDPQFAFDFQTGVSGAKDNNTTSTFTHGGSTYNVVSDDLAFRYRDVAFLRRGVLGSTSLAGVNGSNVTYTLSLSTTWGVDLRANQALVLGCPGGQYVVARASAAVPKGNNSAQVTVTTQGGTPNYPTLIPDCFAQLATAAATGGYVMLMHEVRFRVHRVGLKTYLVIHHNLTDLNDYDPLVADVEDFQVAYLLNRPPPTGGCCAGLGAVDGNWVVGDAANEAFDTTAAPTFDTVYDNSARYTDHPANIRQVRITLVVKSSRRQGTNTVAKMAYRRPQAENSPSYGVAADGYFRSVMGATVRVPNMASRSFFVPPLSSLDPDASSNSGLNTNGG